jgi:hypothetical protein
MAATINGIGTSFCFARGSGGRGGDALECFVVMFLPVVPFKAVHLYGETSGVPGRQYRAVPIRWSASLVLRVYLLYWMAFPLVAGVAMAFLFTYGLVRNGSLDGIAPFFITGWAVTLTCGIGYFLLWWTDRRTRSMRRLLGRHQYGSSDPATWIREVLAGVYSPQETFGVDSFAAAVPALLEKGDYQAAMWAARLATAKEDRATGERLTDKVLRAAGKHPEKVASA